MNSPTVAGHLYRAYSNLAMAHAAIQNKQVSYSSKYYQIRGRLYKGLLNNTMEIRSFFDDERLKMILPQSCCYCGSKEHLAADHIIPQKKGGMDIGENLVWSCRSCNSSKSAKDMLDWMLKKNQFPSVLLYRRYLKIIIDYCKNNGLMDKTLDDIDELSLPFNISTIPKHILELDNLKLWVVDIPDEIIGNNKDLKIKKNTDEKKFKHRIANWNLERPLKINKKSQLAINKINEINADVLVLTETSSFIELNQYPYISRTKEYKDYPNEQSAVIYSKWEIEKEVVRTEGEIASLINTPFGKIIVYAMIISYKNSCINQIKEDGSIYKGWDKHKEEIKLSDEHWRYISSLYPTVPLFVLGDYNQTRDGYKRGYGTEEVRLLLTNALNSNNLTCVTEEDFSMSKKLSVDPKKGKVRRNIDHISISSDFFNSLDEYYIGAWDHFTEDGYYMSDHNGVYIDF